MFFFPYLGDQMMEMCRDGTLDSHQVDRDLSALELWGLQLLIPPRIHHQGLILGTVLQLLLLQFHTHPTLPTLMDSHPSQVQLLQ